MQSVSSSLSTLLVRFSLQSLNRVSQPKSGLYEDKGHGPLSNYQTKIRGIHGRVRPSLSWYCAGFELFLKLRAVPTSNFLG